MQLYLKHYFEQIQANNMLRKVSSPPLLEFAKKLVQVYSFHILQYIVYLLVTSPTLYTNQTHNPEKNKAAIKSVKKIVLLEFYPTCEHIKMDISNC